MCGHCAFVDFIAKGRAFPQGVWYIFLIMPLVERVSGQDLLRGIGVKPFTLPFTAFRVATPPLDFSDKMGKEVGLFYGMVQCNLFLLT